MSTPTLIGGGIVGLAASIFLIFSQPAPFFASNKVPVSFVMTPGGVTNSRENDRLTIGAGDTLEALQRLELGIAELKDREPQSAELVKAFSQAVRTELDRDAWKGVLKDAILLLLGGIVGVIMDELWKRLR